MNLNYSPTTIDTWLKNNTIILKKHKIDSARLDCLIILSDILNVDKSHILAHLEDTLQIETVNLLNTKIAQRMTGVPLAYVRGHVEFYGRKFLVTPHVLVPRPESETMITLLKTLSLPSNASIADVGSGSGCLGITAGLELPESTITCYDIDASTLDIARHTSGLLGLKNINFVVSDLLQNTTGEHDVVLANLPYVPNDYPINYAAQHEPRLALFADENGLALYNRLFKEFSEASWQPSYILTESLPMQHDELLQIAGKYGFMLQAHQGYIHVFSSKSS